MLVRLRYTILYRRKRGLVFYHSIASAVTASGSAIRVRMSFGERQCGFPTLSGDDRLDSALRKAHDEVGTANNDRTFDRLVTCPTRQ